MSDERFPQDLQQLAEQFLASGWTELRVRNGDTEILFSLDPNTPGLGSAAHLAPAQAAASVTAPAPTTGTATPSAAPPPADTGAVDPSWVPVVAPNLGTFYRAPKPGAPPFVEVGSTVEPDTEICLLEVMKLFTSVKAGEAGEVVRICATDSELVDAGRVLYYIKPTGN